MTLDECIDYAEEQSEWMSKPKYAKIDIYKDKSEYYRQLAEWLRELKKYRAIFEKIGRVLGENGYTMDDLDTIFGKVNEEVKADADSD